MSRKGLVVNRKKDLYFNLVKSRSFVESLEEEDEKDSTPLLLSLSSSLNESLCIVHQERRRRRYT